MTVDDRWRFDAPNRSGAKDDDLLRVSIAHHLRNFCFENLDVIDFLKTPANTHRVSGAILYSLEPKQIRLLIDDARTSIVLALQRHFGNERYRKRLMTETHYRILRPHMSAGFRVLMMPPSNWDGYHFPVSRKPNLVVAYQNEIDRLEMEFLMMPESTASYVQSRTRAR